MTPVPLPVPVPVPFYHVDILCWMSTIPLMHIRAFYLLGYYSLTIFINYFRLVSLKSIVDNVFLFVLPFINC